MHHKLNATHNAVSYYCEPAAQGDFLLSMKDVNAMSSVYTATQAQENAAM